MKPAVLFVLELIDSSLYMRCQMEHINQDAHFTEL